jgi:hypothetical protein
MKSIKNILSAVAKNLKNLLPHKYKKDSPVKVEMVNRPESEEPVLLKKANH